MKVTFRATSCVQICGASPDLRYITLHDFFSKSLQRYREFQMKDVLKISITNRLTDSPRRNTQK